MVKEEKITLLDILKGLLFIAFAYLLLMAGNYLFFALGWATGFLFSIIQNPLINIFIGIFLLVGISFLIALGKATGETFGAHRALGIFDIFKTNSKNEKNNIKPG